MASLKLGTDIAPDWNSPSNPTNSPIVRCDDHGVDCNLDIAVGTNINYYRIIE